jgi:Na+-driven multidrug efflux pump
MGKAAASTALSMIREIVFGVGFALLLPVFFGLDGVLYSMPVSDVLTAVASAIVIALTYKELNSKIGQSESKDDMYGHMDVAHTS